MLSAINACPHSRLCSFTPTLTQVRWVMNEWLHHGPTRLHRTSPLPHASASRHSGCEEPWDEEGKGAARQHVPGKAPLDANTKLVYLASSLSVLSVCATSCRTASSLSVLSVLSLSVLSVFPCRQSLASTLHHQSVAMCCRWSTLHHLVPSRPLVVW